MVGDRFQSEFPSLEEQEMMSKKEVDEDRRAKDEGREHSPSSGRQSHDRPWGEPHTHVPRGPPYPHGHYPPHYDPYIIHHPMRHTGELIILCVYSILVIISLHHTQHLPMAVVQSQVVKVHHIQHLIIHIRRDMVDLLTILIFQLTRLMCESNILHNS